MVLAQVFIRKSLVLAADIRVEGFSELVRGHGLGQV